MNLILITIDCLRADAVGFLNGDRRLTPHMDAMARGGTVYERAIAAGIPTYYSFPAIMGGRYPLARGRELIGMGKDELKLASALGAAGYATAGFTAGNPYVSRWTGYEDGFETFEDFVGDAGAHPPAAPRRGAERKSSMRRVAEKIPGARRVYDEAAFWYGVRAKEKEYAGRWETWRRFPNAARLTQAMTDWLDARAPARFFVWLHYMDAHMPRLPSAEGLAAVGRSDLTPRDAHALYNLWIRSDLSDARRMRYREDMLALYAAAIWDADAQIGRIGRELEARGLAERTVVAVTSDHGEAFLERGEHDHEPVALPQELIRVPLVIADPTRAGGRVRAPYSLAELPGTLCEHLGVTFPESASAHPQGGEAGVAITEVAAGYANQVLAGSRITKAAWRLLSVQDARHKLVIDFGKREFWLYDLEADPLEVNPLALSTELRTAGRLLRAARDHLAASAVGQTRAGLEWRCALLSEKLEQRKRAAR